EGKALLAELGAIDGKGRITDEGRRLRQLPLPPRLARMVVKAASAGAGSLAAEIALVLPERGFGGNDVDLGHRLDALRRDRSERAREARAMARRWAAGPPRSGTAQGDASATGPIETSVGALLALAYPDRVAKNRGSGGGFLLANGRGAQGDAASALAREPYLAVAEITGPAPHGRLVLAVALTLDEMEAQLADRIEARAETTFDAATASLQARRLRRLGAIALAAQPIKVEPSEETARMLADGIAQIGIERLPWTKSLRQWRDRVLFLPRAEGEGWPDLSDAALAATVQHWLQPILLSRTTLNQIGSDDLTHAVEGLLPWNLRRRLEAEAPTHFAAPSGSLLPIDYQADEGPKLSIRVQELFGLDRHPTIAGGRVPLIVELLSPAHRPVQVTRDLPGFWRGSYAAVRSEMKGRYPRHPWPDDPLAAPA